MFNSMQLSYCIDIYDDADADVYDNFVQSTDSTELQSYSNLMFKHTAIHQNWLHFPYFHIIYVLCLFGHAVVEISSKTFTILHIHPCNQYALNI